MSISYSLLSICGKILRSHMCNPLIDINVWIAFCRRGNSRTRYFPWHTLFRLQALYPTNPHAPNCHTINIVHCLKALLQFFNNRYCPNTRHKLGLRYRSCCWRCLPICRRIGDYKFRHGFLDSLFIHDDVIKWKHFPRYWTFVWGIYRSPVNFPHKGQWRGAFYVFLDLRPNKQLSKQWWGWWFGTQSCPLWRHTNVMSSCRCTDGIV